MAAGLDPPARFGPEVVARLLGLRTDHPQSQEYLETPPSGVASRAEAAFSAAKILGWQGWEKQYVTALSATIAVPVVTGWQQTILKQAVSLIGYPYVFAGTSERPQTVLGKAVPGGFDCSGFVWRVYRLAPYAKSTPLADSLQGRTDVRDERRGAGVEADPVREPRAGRRPLLRRRRARARSRRRSTTPGSTSAAAG